MFQQLPPLWKRTLRKGREPYLRQHVVFQQGNHIQRLVVAGEKNHRQFPRILRLHKTAEQLASDVHRQELYLM